MVKGRTSPAGPNFEFSSGDEMGQVGRSCLDCGRFNSVFYPCPYKDNRLVLKERLWARGITILGPLADEEERRLKLLSSICVDFIKEPGGRIEERKNLGALRSRRGGSRDRGMNGKKGSEFISTGEAAKMLGVSRPTVQHHFDMKNLKGKKHPITGRRSVSRKSVLALMKRKGMK